MLGHCLRGNKIPGPLYNRFMERLTTKTRDRLWFIWTDVWPVVFLVVGLSCAIALPFLAVDRWDSEWTVPGLIGSFSATTFAFLIGLAWDRRQRTAEDRKEALVEEARKLAELDAEQERRTLEAKRRFGALALELERLKATIDRTMQQSKYKYFLPDLPTGTWRAAGAPLGTIISNYALMADLSTFYGQVSELQWRLRFKAQPGVDVEALNPIIDALTEQMLKDVDSLLTRVRKQTVDPDVAHIDGAGDDVGALVGRRQLTRAIRALTTYERELTPTAPER
jgi:hypothetical protein